MKPATDREIELALGASDPFGTPEYHRYVMEAAKRCHCEGTNERPCDGVLAGGMCDRRKDEIEDENESLDETCYGY